MRYFSQQISSSSLIFAVSLLPLFSACASEEAGEASGQTDDDGTSETGGAGIVAAAGGNATIGSGSTASTGGSSNGDGDGSNNGSGGTSTASGGSTAGGKIFGETRSGEATYYSATGEGACSFDASPNDLMVAALNSPDWSGSDWCGACAQVSGPAGEVVVRIVDLCPECKSGDLDLSPQAFDQIAAREQGRVAVAWTFVSCPVSGPVRYRFKDGAHQYWTAVQVHNHALPIRTMDWSKDGKAWTQMPREDYNYFLEADGFGEGASFVRITAVDGQQLTDELPAVVESLVVEGSAQFQ